MRSETRDADANSEPTAVARAHEKGERPKVVLVEADPYLAFLIRLHVPEADVVEAEPGASGNAIAKMSPSLVVLDADVAPNPLPELLAMEHTPKILAVVDRSRVSRPTLAGEVEAILLRPFVPADLERAVRAALGLGARLEEAGWLRTPGVRTRTWLGPGRVIALGITAVLEVGGAPVSRGRGLVLGAALIYAALRWILRRPTVVGDAADIAVACALIATTGGLYSNYLPFGIVATFGVGLMHGPNPGIIAGILVVSASVPSIWTDVRSGVTTVREASSWFMLLPLLGATGGFSSRVLRLADDQGVNLLVEANQVLSSLYRIARSLPGGLEIGSVADATLAEIREGLRSSAGAMLLAEAGSYMVVGSYGMRDPSKISLREGDALSTVIGGARPIVKVDELHPNNAAAMGDFSCWLTAPVRRDGVMMGVLLAACPDEDKHDANRLLLTRLADEAGVAAENARLFSQVREISIDEERQRLARELHDGVAQSLTHLRYELDFMGRHSAAPVTLKREISRLSRVVERASNDVRSMIMGLRSSIVAEGLTGALRSYLRDLRSLGGPEIVFDARGEARVPPDIEAELFRIAQEAVSNALRHAGATSIKVRLTSGVTMLRLIVEDDGRGIDKKKRLAPGGGVGLGAMRERAELINARLEMGQAQDGGTRVTVEYDLKEKT